MNDEIKEILDILQKCKDYDDEVFLIKQHSATLLLDYITNLQQENFNLRENILIHKMSFKSDDKSLEHLINMPSYEELQQENEYLKLSNPEMNIEHFRIINENKRKIDNLRKQNKELQQENERLKEYKSKVDDIGKLTSRIYKAIEYIKENQEDKKLGLHDLRLNSNKLLNILRGDNK